MAAPGVGYFDPLGRYSISVLNSWITKITLAAVLGFLSGLGVGGGSLLILWLTLVLQLPTQTARTINLLFFIPCALVACFFRWKQGQLKILRILPAVLAGCACALLIGWVSPRIPQNAIRKLFGGLLIITGLRELFYKQKAGH